MAGRAPVSVRVRYPETEAGLKALACQVSGVQADFVVDAIGRLPCPPAQRLELLGAVIGEARQAKRARGERCENRSGL